MAKRRTDPARDDLHPPGPEEHPGEIGPLLDAERTRLKTPHRERVRPDDAPSPSESEPTNTTAGR
jgi:hypothetical protein